LHALSHRRLREADDLADGGVRAASVLLELLDDRLRHVVEVGAFPITRCLTHPGIVTGERISHK
jgi:hypothetical protein